MPTNKVERKAIAPMQNFIKNHPNSVYTGNAYFWLAEFNLATDPVNYNEAKKNYNVVATQYPNSSKAPRALYQLYSIAKDVDKNTVSANQYKAKILSQYPKSEEAKFLTNKVLRKRHRRLRCLFEYLGLTHNTTF